MTDSEFIQELRNIVGPSVSDRLNNTALLNYIVFYYNAAKELETQGSNATQEHRGIEDLLGNLNLGSPEAMVGAILIQIFAKYSAEIVAEFLDFLKDKDNSNEQKEVSGDDRRDERIDS